MKNSTKNRGPITEVKGRGQQNQTRQYYWDENMSKKVNIIVTQPPYGKEDAYSAIPLVETQATAGNSPSITFVSGGVHSVVKGQKTEYGDAAVWQKDVPSVEASIRGKRIVHIPFHISAFLEAIEAI